MELQSSKPHGGCITKYTQVRDKLYLPN